MGLTIGYELRAPVDAARARTIVQRLREHALSLPFARVTEVSELDPPDRGAGQPVEEDKAGGLRLHGACHVEVPSGTGDEEYATVDPIHVIRFVVQPNGAETACIGLASHPDTVAHRRGDSVIEVTTGLGDVYAWHSSCKTQYAALPDRGGVANFLEAHLALIELLDKARDLGCEVVVRDGGGYWEHRDQRRLLESLEEWNRLVAGFVGSLRDTARGIEGRFSAPITDYPDFEKLEFEGRRRR